MQGPQAHILPDGRLHLHHGPIDLLIGVTGDGRRAARQRAVACFDRLLQALADELPELRTPLEQEPQLVGPVAQKMLAAVRPYAGQFVTPMAAVAGAVADHVLAALSGPDLHKAYVNNGGDIAVYLGAGQTYTGAIAHETAARLHLAAHQPWRGVATSGWRGRSLSLGIADAVTVIAKTAAAADVAATMIANAVDLPDHPAIERQAACDLVPDSDLGHQQVTISVGKLPEAEVAKALKRGRKYAAELVRRGRIGGALLMLQGETTDVGESGFRLKNIGADDAEV
jgi:ApbE superfamily uncharacterized protein (UPF0280 family)